MGLVLAVQGASAVEVECRPEPDMMVVLATTEKQPATKDAKKLNLPQQLKNAKGLPKCCTAERACGLAVVQLRHTAWGSAGDRQTCLTEVHVAGPARRGRTALPDPQACGIVLAVVLS